MDWYTERVGTAVRFKMLTDNPKWAWLLRSRRMPWVALFLTNYLFLPSVYLADVFLPGTVLDPEGFNPGIVYVYILMIPLLPQLDSVMEIIVAAMVLFDGTGGQDAIGFDVVARYILSWPISILLGFGIVRVIRELWRGIRSWSKNGG